MAGSDNPALPGSLRIFSGAVILVLLVGAGLFFVPDMVKPRWPWPLAPFNARFLGSFYLAEMVAMVALLVVEPLVAGPDDPGHGVRLHAGGDGHLAHQSRPFQFRPQSLGWLWFAVYAGSAIVAGLFLWNARGTPPVAAAMSGAGWRRYFRLEAVLLGLYGLGLLDIAGDLQRVLAMEDRRVPRPDLQRDLHHRRDRDLADLEPCAARGTGGARRGAAGIGLLLDHRACRHRRRGQARRLGGAGTWLWLALFALIGATGSSSCSADRGERRLVGRCALSVVSLPFIAGMADAR